LLRIRDRTLVRVLGWFLFLDWSGDERPYVFKVSMKSQKGPYDVPGLRDPSDWQAVLGVIGMCGWLFTR
jgi:hypothetical protein